jgi:pyrroloquinoline quinone biosynthesis protein D
MTMLRRTSRPRLVPKARLRLDAITGRYLLIYPEHGLELGDTAAAILQACEGNRDVTDIVRELMDRYPSTDPLTLEHEVLEFLETMAARGLVCDEAPPPPWN